MYTGHGSDPMPADKMMKLFIIQSISAFVANDYNTGLHFLGEIKQSYAENMGKLNPTLKQVAKEIIQAVDMFNPDGSGFPGASMSNSLPDSPAQSSDQNPSMPNFDNQQQAHSGAKESDEKQPRSVTHELQDLLNRRKAKRRK